MVQISEARIERETATGLSRIDAIAKIEGRRLRLFDTLRNGVGHGRTTFPTGREGI